MTLARVALFAALAGSACAVAEEAPPGGHPPSVEESADVTEALASPPSVEEDLCDALPDEGPCSLACDPDALRDEYVPAGTCAAFACTLTDGRTITLHACHVPED